MENFRIRESSLQQELAHILYGRTISFMNEKGIGIVERRLDNGNWGQSLGGIILIDERIDPVAKFATLIHEAVHELFHPTVHGDKVDGVVEETHAEAISYGVLHYFGINNYMLGKAYIMLHGDVSIVKRDKKLIKDIRNYFVGNINRNSTNHAQAA